MWWNNMGAAGLWVLSALIIILPSFRFIGPTEVGLVFKRFGWRKLKDGSPLALHGEAGYQAFLRYWTPEAHLRLYQGFINAAAEKRSGQPARVLETC